MFSLKRDLYDRQLRDRFSNIYDIVPEGITFSFDGDILRPNFTLNDVDLENEDLIDVKV